MFIFLVINMIKNNKLVNILDLTIAESQEKKNSENYAQFSACKDIVHHTGF